MSKYSKIVSNFKYLIFIHVSICSAYDTITLGPASTVVPELANNTYDGESNSHTYSDGRLETFFGIINNNAINPENGMFIPFSISERLTYTADKLLDKSILLVIGYLSAAENININNSYEEYIIYDFVFSDTSYEEKIYTTHARKSFTYKQTIPTLLSIGFPAVTFYCKVEIVSDGLNYYVLWALYNSERVLDGDAFFSSFTSTYRLNPDLDVDGDGLSNKIERFILGSDHLSADSNGDGINDFDSTFIRAASDLNSAVISRATSFGLLTESEVIDLRPSSTLISVDGDNAVLSLGIEESSNLTDWVDTGETVDANLSAPQGTRFYRFKMTD